METPIKPSVVTGAGRCGTSAFMRFIIAAKGPESVITRKRLPANATFTYTEGFNAGYEYTLNLESSDEEFQCAPKFIKDPRFCVTIRGLIEKNKVIPEHLFILIRDYKKSARSRIKNGLEWNAQGPIRQFDQKYDRLKNQEIFMQRAIGYLINTVAMFDVPHTIISFPRFVKDKDYFYNKLKGTTLDPLDYDFDEAYKIFDPQLVHH